MKIGPIFGEAWSLYKKHFWVVTTIMATVWIPVEIIHSSVTARAGAYWGMLAMIAGGFVATIATGAVFHFGLGVREERLPSYGEAMQVGFRRWGAMIGTQIMAGLLTLLGLVFLVLPGIYVAFRLSFITVVVVGEGLSGGAAINRSFALTKDRFADIFKVGLLAGIIPFLILIPFVGLGYALGPQNAEVINFVSALTGEIFGAYVILVYVCAYPFFVRPTEAGLPPPLEKGRE